MVCVFFHYFLFTFVVMDARAQSSSSCLREHPGLPKVRLSLFFRFLLYTPVMAFPCTLSLVMWVCVCVAADVDGIAVKSTLLMVVVLMLMLVLAEATILMLLSRLAVVCDGLVWFLLFFCFCWARSTSFVHGCVRSLQDVVWYLSLQQHRCCGDAVLTVSFLLLCIVCARVQEQAQPEPECHSGVH